MKTQQGDGLPPYSLDSVDKALQLLVLLRERQQVRVVDVSAELGVARSTAHRLLSTLAHRGFALRDPLTRSYQRGPELMAAAPVVLPANVLLDVARVHLEELSSKLRETVNLVVLEGSYCRFIDGVSSDRPLRTSVRTGTLVPAHATSGGKALLAEQPSQELHKLYARGLRRLTPNTIVDLAQLEQALRKVREDGYAINSDESELGLSAIACTIRHSGVAIGAIAVSTPSVRLQPEHIPPILKALRRSAQRASAALDATPLTGP